MEDIEHHRLNYCRICNHHTLNHSSNSICSLTQKAPDFTEKCPSFLLDKSRFISLYKKSDQQINGLSNEYLKDFAKETYERGHTNMLTTYDTEFNIEYNAPDYIPKKVDLNQKSSFA